MMPMVGAYEDKTFKSVTRGAADLDKVAEIVIGLPNYMTIIRNKEMAASKRKLFEYFWRHADEIPG